MYIDQGIINAEKKWLAPLKQFTSEHFSSTFLPSHDHLHHERTWNIAKNLLAEIARINLSITSDFIEALLIATMLHDTGMTITRSKDHGAHSKDVFLNFARRSPLNIPLKDEITYAIDQHDRKGQDIYQLVTIDKCPDLLTLTSIADDLDALGSIGIYRYTEIYLHRKIPLRSLGMRVLENVSARYNMFAKAMALFPLVLKSQGTAYSEIITFFDRFNQQLLIETNPELVYSGHIGVVNYIKQFSVDGDIPPSEFSISLKDFQVQKFIKDYFSQLSKSIS